MTSTAQAAPSTAPSTAAAVAASAVESEPPEAADAPVPEPRLRPRRGRRGLLWLGFLGAGSLAVAATVLPTGSAPVGRLQTYAPIVIAAAAGAAVLVGIRLRRPARRLPWVLVAVLTLVLLAGSVPAPAAAERVLSQVGGWAEASRLAAAVVLIGALTALLRAGRSPRPTTAEELADAPGAAAGWLDALLVGSGAGLVGWVVLLDPASSGALPPATRLVPVVLAILLLVLVTRLLGRGRPGVPLGLGLLAGVAFVAATAVAALPPGSGMRPELGELIAAAAGLAVPVLWGAAALHPAMRTATEPVRRPACGSGVVQVVLVVAALLTAPATLMVQSLSGRPLALWPTAVAAAVVLVLVGVRMAVASGQVRWSRRRAARLSAELAHARSHDALTDLPDRAETVRELKRVLVEARRAEQTAALLVVDLSGFATVVEQYGHPAGDQVLRAVARRLGSVAPTVGLVGRLSGDVFAVAVTPVAGRSGAVAVAGRVHLAVSAPVSLPRGEAVRVHACIGVALTGHGPADPYATLQEAEVALRRAEATGPGRTEVFDEPLRRERERVADLHAGLRRALRGGELVAHYEPEFAPADLPGDLTPASLHDGLADERSARARGYALHLSWDRPEVGLMPLGDFLAETDDPDLVADIEAWALQQACRRVAAWSQAGDDIELSVAVPVSGRSLLHTRIISDVTAALDGSLLAPAQLVLEIADPRSLGDPLASVTLERLRTLRVRIAVTGFGTGAGSLLDPAAGSADQVVIDCRAIRLHTASPEAVAALLVTAARAADVAAVATGVQDVAVLTALRDAGIDRIRGALLSPAAAETVIDRRRAVRAELVNAV